MSTTISVRQVGWILLILGLGIGIFGYLCIQINYGEASLMGMSRELQESISNCDSILVSGIILAVIGFGCIISDIIADALYRQEEIKTEELHLLERNS
jgi:hypothetical protein